MVPEAYRQTVDLEDPETRRVFSRGWRSPRQLRSMGVEYVILPEAAYGRYLRPISAPEGSAAIRMMWSLTGWLVRTGVIRVIELTWYTQRKFQAR